MLFTNYGSRVLGLKRQLQIVAAFCAFFAFTGNSFAQEVILTQKQIDWVATSSFLSRTIADGSIEQKRNALGQIRNLETAEASRIAVAALKDSSEIVRATAAASVIFLPPDEAARNLLPLLADKKPLVRRETAYALGKVGDPISIDSLLRVLQKDKIVEVRGAAIIALGEIGDVSAIGELVKFLQRKPQAKEEFLRRSAARSIGQIAQIIQTGERQIITPENFLPERFKSINQPKYQRLAENFPAFRSAIIALVQTLSDPREFGDVKREAAFALGAIGDAAAIPVLQTKASDADYYLAEICRESLLKIAAASNR